MNSFLQVFGLLVALQFDEWQWKEWLAFTLLILVGYRLITSITQMSVLFGWAGRIEVRGKRLEDEDLSNTDYLYVLINELVTVYYIYFLSTTIRSASWIDWDPSHTTVANTVGLVLLSLGSYDLIYVPFHRTLHIPMFYT